MKKKQSSFLVLFSTILFVFIIILGGFFAFKYIFTQTKEEILQIKTNIFHTFEGRIEGFQKIDSEKAKNILFIDNIISDGYGEHSVSEFEEKLKGLGITGEVISLNSLTESEGNKIEYISKAHKERELQIMFYPYKKIKILVVNVLGKEMKGRERGIIAKYILFFNERGEEMGEVNIYKSETINLLGENILLYQKGGSKKNLGFIETKENHEKFNELYLSFINPDNQTSKTIEYKDFYTTIISLGSHKLFLSDDTRQNSKKILNLETGKEEKLEENKNNVFLLGNGYYIQSNNGNLKVLMGNSEYNLSKVDRGLNNENISYTFERKEFEERDYMVGESIDEYIFIYMGENRPFIEFFNKNNNTFIEGRIGK